MATASLGLLATPDVCRATFILSPLPDDTPILQLPELPSTRGFQVLEPRTATSIFIETGNIVRANSTTDRLERTPQSADWEDFRFVPDNPNVITGLAFDASYSSFGGFAALLIVEDQFGRGRAFNLRQSNQRVSIVGINGETIRSLSFSTRGLGFVGPFQVQVVPEPSSLISCLTATLTILGFQWRRWGRPGR